MFRSSPPSSPSFNSSTQDDSPTPTSTTSTSTFSRFGLGRAKGPPARSQTYDDHYYLGPGAPSAQTRGYAPALPSINSATNSNAGGSNSNSNSLETSNQDGWPSQFLRSSNSNTSNISQNNIGVIGGNRTASRGTTATSGSSGSSLEDHSHPQHQLNASSSISVTSSSSNSTIHNNNHPNTLSASNQFHPQPQWGQPQVAPQHYSSIPTSHSQQNAFLPPRALGLYNQQNHSSPSLGVNTSRHSGEGSSAALQPGPLSASVLSNQNSLANGNEPPIVPPIPSLDDINLGLESMSFEQLNSQRSSAGTASSVNPNFAASGGNGRGYGPSGPDGAMEIRGRDGTASVYSLDSMYSNTSVPGPSHYNHARTTSNNSANRHFGPVGAGAEHRRVSQQSLQGGQGTFYDDEASSLPYDDHYREIAQNLSHQQHQHEQQHQSYPSSQPGGSPHPSIDYRGSHFEGGPSGAPSLHHQSSYASSTYSGSEVSYQHPVASMSGAPQFSPQPPHGGWGYEQRDAVAAQNPYYAAQLGPGGVNGPYSNDPNWNNGGQHPSLARQPSTLSNLSMGSGMMPPPSVNLAAGGAAFARSGSSLHVPAVQPRMQRKGTGSSNTSSLSNNSGPPITKASVDEYRQRIKADPDPEAQFNFAKYLIEAAKKINSSSSGDEKSAKKYRDALLAESLKLIKRLATQGSGVGKPAYADAQFFLANCLGNGSLGLQVDHEKAYNLYVQASKQNHSSATYRTAVCNEVGAGTRRDHARAVLFYRKASALGDTAGMYKLGMILLNGLLGQQRNPKEAVNWLKRAASQADEDNPHALHELGLLYEKPPPPVQTTGPNGGPPMLIVPCDPAQARELFTQAGQLGYPPSQFKLGSCYEYGSLTCPVDPRRSIAWYTRAAERGDAESELALSGWYLTGSDGVLKQSDSEAYLWARRAANKGLPKAEYAVGYYSEVGIGVKQDLEEAKRWYMRSAAQGNKRAMQRLTELKKLGAAKAAKGGKGAARPTRQEAATECIIM